MSDNITREPYRNAWYKQLADAVKKHDEEIAEMTPHLVPDVEEGDNGKILIAGEEGAFDWGQPPEELPVITEGDEGKVLKVYEGVPKWLEDQDAEIPSHTTSDEGKMLSVNAQNDLEWKDVPDELPSFSASDINKYLKVNGTGDGVEWGQLSITNTYVVTMTDPARFNLPEGVTAQGILNRMNNGEMCFLLARNTNYEDYKIFFFATPEVSNNRLIAYTFHSSNSEIYLTIYKSQGNNQRSFVRDRFANFVTITPNDYNKFLMNVSGDLRWVELPKELPAATSADEGKVVMVDSNGNYVLGTVSGGYVVPYSIDSATFSDNVEVPNNA